MHCRLISILLTAAAIVGTVHAQSPSGSEWRVIDAANFEPSRNDQQKSALQARDELFRRLSGRLTEVMKQQGPAAAIAVCQSEAPTIAKKASDEFRVRIGRTSSRLRNQANRAPEWAGPQLKKVPETPVWLAGPKGELGAILPIRLKAECLTCHGPTRTQPVEVRTELAKRYPNDRATGYAEGDLRGWFWVEVPAPSK